MTKVQAPTPAGQTARTTTYAYDSMDRLTTVTDPLGLQTVYGHDADGNVVTVTDPLGRTTTTQFDAMDRPVVVIDPMGSRVTTTFDADGEALTVTDALNRTTTYAYSVRGWVATVTDPMGFVSASKILPATLDPPRYGISCMARMVSLHQARSFVRGRSMVIGVCPGQRTQIEMLPEPLAHGSVQICPILRFVNASNADHLPVTDDLACMIGTPGRSIDRSSSQLKAGRIRCPTVASFCCRGGIWSTA